MLTSSQKGSREIRETKRDVPNAQLKGLEKKTKRIVSRFAMRLLHVDHPVH
jgi:hypothetical protein